jgi:hypothetical protein
MERVQDRERREALVILFSEKVVLAAVAPLLVLLVVNPMKFDLHQQISAAIVLLAMGYFVAHTLEKKAAAPPAPSVATPVQPSRATGAATTHGNNSPANTGDGNTFGSGDPKKPPPKPKK